MDAARRRWFLSLVVFIANAFLVTFGTEAVLSIVNALAFQGHGPAPLVSLQGLVGGLAWLLWALMILVLIFVPHLPKSVFLAPVLVMLWQAVGAPPIKWSILDPATWAPIDAVGLVSVLFAFLGIKISTDSWFLRAAILPHKENLLRRTLIALPVSVVIIVVTALGAAVVGVRTFADQSTAGYLHLSSTGIEVRETVFRKGDQVIHLVATVHFAEPSFYKDLYASIPADAVILAEGVTDREGKLKGGLSYNNAAGAIGLQSQEVFEDLIRAPAPAGTPSAPGAPQPQKPAVIRADIDISELSPVTLRFLERVGDIYASHSLAEVLKKLDVIGKEFTDADIKTVMNDILLKRNARVLAELDKQLPAYKTVFIPWGAEHMPGLDKAILERGFKAEAMSFRQLARYQTIVDALKNRTPPSKDQAPAAPAAAN